MTNLKDLLDHAAGAEPVFTDADLTADLARGRSSLRRRRAAGIASAALGVTLVAGVGLTVLPGHRTGSTEAPVATSATNAGPGSGSVTEPWTAVTSIPGVTFYKLPSRGPEKEATKVPAAPAEPVALVPAGDLWGSSDLVCTLMPKGWKIRVIKPGAGYSTWTLIMYDPKLDPSVYNEDRTQLSIREAEIRKDPGTGQMLVEKYEKPWSELKHLKAGRHEAVWGPSGRTPGQAMGEVHVKVGATRLVQVDNAAPSLGWDLTTLLRFAGSCGYAG
jgi:hypothetical protein